MPGSCSSALYPSHVCGRYTYLFTWKQLHALLSLVDWPAPELTPRFNVAPLQAAPVVRLNAHAQRVGVLLRWGLIPSWADDPAIASRLINARAETVFDKPAFRTSAAERRCLIPVSGFYEWQQLPALRLKQPYWIGREDRAPLCFAGLWDSWHSRTPSSDHAPESVDTFTILTTTPNQLMRPLHDRMPVILPPDAWQAWLSPSTDRATLSAMMVPCPPDGLIAYPVSRDVGSPAKDTPALMEPAKPLAPPPSLFEQ